MVEIEVRKSEAVGEKATITNLDVSEIIGKVRAFVDNIREMSAGGEPMTVSVEGFNFSLAKEQGEYDLTLKVNLLFKPKN
jgi:hypothetical protein